jgi:glycosyltransferase involved in cell wall biosynthesis
MKKHKILYLDEIGRIDGAEVVLYNLVTNMDKDRFEPLVVCGSEGNLVEKLRSENIQVCVLKMKETSKLTFSICGVKIFNPISAVVNAIYGIIYGLQFYLFLRKNTVDIVYTNTLLSNLFGSIPAKLTGKKLIWHEHNIQPPGFRRKFINVMARLFPDRIIAISNAVRSIYSSIPDGPKIKIINNGIDLTKFHTTKHEQGLRDELNIPSDFQVVAITAVLRPWKGQKYFLLAAKEILRNYKKVKFLIVGDEVFSKDSGYKDSLKNLTSELGIERDVIFTGFRTDIPRILSEIDILVSTSILPEPFSLIILEAMASGKPVVATRTGGVPEVVEDKLTAILVDPENSEQLSTAILRLLEDTEAAQEMGRAGRKRAEELFSIQRFIGDVEKVYVDVLSSEI